jgi:hypothetical protein
MLVLSGSLPFCVVAACSINYFSNHRKEMPVDFRFDPSQPELQTPRDQDSVLIEILWSVGRSVKVKRKLLTELMALLTDSGPNPKHVMAVFKETAWENWTFGGGRVIHG